MSLELPERILALLANAKLKDSLQLAQEFNEDHQKIVGAIKSLECLGDVVKTESKSVNKYELTKEGAEVAQRGSHEAVVFSRVPADGVSQTELMKLLGDVLGAYAKVGFSKAMSSGWLSIDKSSGQPKIIRKVAAIDDEVQAQLQLVSNGLGQSIPTKVRDDFKKRKLLQESVVKYYEISPGSNFSTTIQKPETELTSEMITSGSWKNATFKPYNFEALGIQPHRGHLHPLLKVRAEYRQIFLEMGFSEMPTNNFIESSFWNFDALFQPQQHPARDAHDTFFISDPAEAVHFPMDYLEKVKRVHSCGGYGSQGYGYDWKIEEAKKNLLRTHTTAVSARMLYKLAQEYKKTGVFVAQKYFSIDRVFRNETLDATHLAEFHQIEGLVADRDLTLGDLLGVISEFFKKLGMKKLRFKPAYNPYTEPSMEIFSYHEGLKKWVEIGNSGIFRPEMLLPMGLPEDVNVIAWGLSLERPTMIKYGIDNIRDLVGHKVNLQMVQENPLCRLDKNDSDPVAALARVTENRWIKIESQLEFLMKRAEILLTQKGIVPKTTAPKAAQAPVRNLVIWADPQYPPYSIPVLCSALARSQTVSVTIHSHSSLAKNLPEHLKSFFEEKEFPEKDWRVTLIWKNVGKDPVLILSPINNQVIRGECNIVRYFARCLEEATSLVTYEKLSPAVTYRIDDWLDGLHQVIHGDGDAILKDIAAQLKSKGSLVPEAGKTSLPDLVLASLCKQGTNSASKRKEIKDWSQKFCPCL